MKQWYESIFENIVLKYEYESFTNGANTNVIFNNSPIIFNKQNSNVIPFVKNPIEN
jgi:hypothetical protein